MSRKLSRRSVVKSSLAALSAAALARPARARSASKPNILILMADDAGAREFGIYGNKAIATPNIDRLGQEGLVADAAILTTPQCSPSRISILTGLHPHATGAEDLHIDMPAEHRIMPHWLSQAGYFTGSLRKQHFGPHAEAQFDWYQRELGAFPQFLDAAGERPFFMWVGFIDPHRPYRNDSAPERTDPAAVKVPPWLVDGPGTRRDLADYYDEITRMDGAIGRMVAELEARGQRENTFILFISDNGAPFPRAKGSLYDAGIRTPFVANWPGVIAPGQRHGGVLSVIDIAPTVLDMAGLRPPLHLHGTSILPGLTDPSRFARSRAFSQRNWHNSDEHMRSVRTARYKLIRNAYLDLPLGLASDIGSSPAFAELSAARAAGTLTPAQALRFQAPRPRYELYDLEADPWELTNLAGRPEVRDIETELVATLSDWRSATGDFEARYRRRADNVDRVTGERVPGLREHLGRVPPLQDDLPR